MPVCIPFISYVVRRKLMLLFLVERPLRTDCRGALILMREGPLVARLKLTSSAFQLMHSFKKEIDVLNAKEQIHFGDIRAGNFKQINRTFFTIRPNGPGFQRARLRPIKKIRTKLIGNENFAAPKYEPWHAVL